MILWMNITIVNIVEEILDGGGQEQVRDRVLNIEILIK